MANRNRGYGSRHGPSGRDRQLRRDQFDGDAIGITQLQRWVIILEDDAVMLDADSGEMGGPGVERAAVRHGERQVIERLPWIWWGAAIGMTVVGQYDDDSGISMAQRDVPVFGVFGIGLQPESSGVPLGTRGHIGDRELHVRKARDGRSDF